jgi:hypothetical protein
MDIYLDCAANALSASAIALPISLECMGFKRKMGFEIKNRYIGM